MAKTPDGTKAKLGRPVKPVPADTAVRIVRELATGKPLTIICDAEGMPDPSTVWDWMQKDHAFAQAIARAREVGFDRIAMDAMAIADHSENDTVTTDAGDRPNSEWISRSRLRVDTRLKLLAKWDPKRYGEMIKTEITGANGGPIRSESAMSPEQSAALDGYLIELKDGLRPPGT